MTALTYFEPSRQGLADELPGSLADAGELAYMLDAAAALVDAAAADAERTFNGLNIDTAGYDELLSEWAVLYGMEREQLPYSAEGLRMAIKSRMAEDGSLESLQRVLIAIIMGSPENLVDQPTVQFPLGGAGIQFPADGSGIGPLYEAQTTPLAGLQFPADGSGLIFPADGSGLVFATAGWLEIVESPADYSLTVYVRTWLKFDRGAFRRAVDRHRSAHIPEPNVHVIETIAAVI